MGTFTVTMIITFHSSCSVNIMNAVCCHDATSSQVIATFRIKANVGQWAACNSQTCAVYKSAKHNGLYPQDAHEVVFEQIALRDQGQTCSKCHHVVMLDCRCFHTTSINNISRQIHINQCQFQMQKSILLSVRRSFEDVRMSSTRRATSPHSNASGPTRNGPDYRPPFVGAA